ncbi:hypothetical protein RM553_18245 [Zunongwangia sp. F363]|uniref:Uncharacterized protein n=1 Tax=Autumnicola tepida TaxID=3075595 RepID=A0ABU3CEY1_9FLAO|nr:hypothetical protein [Zunongwangia sp. F363]MDT0644787.1 hypothetical protein [Zunongwangia sp. F363]
MKNSQLVNSILIAIGGALLIYVIAVKDASPYFKIAGLIIIMFGLYRATNYWVATKDDHKEDEHRE